MPAGLPNWNGLKSQLIEALVEKARDMPEGDRKLLLHYASAAEKLSPWFAFDGLRKELGPVTYRETIRKAFKPAASAAAPRAYEDLWKLRIAGMINLNLDRLATKAYYKISEQPSIEFDASRLGPMTSVLSSTRPFICNLHGRDEDFNSWVFTASELHDLMKKPAYQHFIRGCLSAYTVLFIGISADDVAVGGNLEALHELGIDPGTHYWVTDRRDKATDQIAEKLGIRIIRYDAPDHDHSALQGFFDDLLAFVPYEPAHAAPIVPSHVSVAKRPLPAPSELRLTDTDQLREMLNAEAKSILEVPAGAGLPRYEKFLADYDEAIYRSWYVAMRPGSDHLMGYQLIAERARGSFGKVYQALDPENNLVALKLLLEEVRNDPEVVNSFRRGVRSMRILKEGGVQHMVEYLDAAEIPAFVVMEWIDGPSLREIIKTRKVIDWHLILRIGSELAEILKSAHALPARVLHRDVRPSNIMLKDFVTTPDDWHVVVLDFDLSWHKGSEEKSVTHGSTTFGYLAPEQILSIPGASTRNAAVDSFGIGMTLYYIISGQDPVPLQHQHRDWVAQVEQAAQGIGTSQWKSLSQRFKRVILNATTAEQSQRWDMTQIGRELKRLQSAATDPRNVMSAELLAEELAARSFNGRYKWNDNHLAAVTELASGVIVECIGRENDGEVEVHISWTSGGHHEYKKVGKWVAPALHAAVSQFKKFGWQILDEQIDATYSLRIHARLSVESIRTGIDRQCMMITALAESLQLE